MTSREAPKPLTEEQRNQVRSLLKQLGEASVIRSKSKRKHSTKHSTVSKRRKTTSKHLSLKYIKPKLEDSPFDGIEEGKTVDGIGLPPTCFTMPVVQRVRLMLIPLFYDDVPVDREFLIKMVKLLRPSSCLLNMESKMILHFLVCEQRKRQSSMMRFSTA